ncbi:MAG: response regulator transcription factor [bacterium]|nr:response regulator transcription factor [bacterium]
MISVMIVDDHPVVREGLVKLFENEDDIEICGGADDANVAIRFIEKLKPDVVIVDIILKGSANGLELVRAISQRFRNVATLVFSMLDEVTYAERSLQSGARGYIAKNEAPDVIIEAIRKVHKGELVISKSIADNIDLKLVHGPGDGKEPTVDLLTNRELEVFRLMGNGYETKEIAQKLNLSKHTIETHRRNIKEKLKIRNNNELIKTAAQWIISDKKNH